MKRITKTLLVLGVSAISALISGTTVQADTQIQLKGVQAQELASAFIDAGAQMSLIEDENVLILKNILCEEGFDSYRERPYWSCEFNQWGPRLYGLRGKAAERIIDAIDGAGLKGEESRNGRIYKVSSLKCEGSSCTLRL